MSSGDVYLNVANGFLDLTRRRHDAGLVNENVVGIQELPGTQLCEIKNTHLIGGLPFIPIIILPRVLNFLD